MTPRLALYGAYGQQLALDRVHALAVLLAEYANAVTKENFDPDDDAPF